MAFLFELLHFTYGCYVKYSNSPIMLSYVVPHVWKWNKCTVVANPYNRQMQVRCDQV
jgi:hypothetical protein